MPDRVVEIFKTEDRVGAPLDAEVVAEVAMFKAALFIVLEQDMENRRPVPAVPL